jgi:hypothetical protein
VSSFRIDKNIGRRSASSGGHLGKCAWPTESWFHSPMRWKPETERCPECEFNWNVASGDVVSLVATSATRIAMLFKGSEETTRRPSQEVWSPSEYLWHLVDVLRIGSDRLLTASIDPAAGIPCWDENALAEVRQYDRLSPRVAVVAYEAAASAWVAVANLVPVDASVEHPEFGTLTAEDIIRRNAHEVQHHELDIRRGLKATDK